MDARQYPTETRLEANAIVARLVAAAVTYDWDDATRLLDIVRACCPVPRESRQVVRGSPRGQERVHVSGTGLGDRLPVGRWELSYQAVGDREHVFVDEASEGEGLLAGRRPKGFCLSFVQGQPNVMGEVRYRGVRFALAGFAFGYVSQTYRPAKIPLLVPPALAPS